MEYGIGSLQKDMVRLNTLITDKRGKQERLAQGNILTENDFINALKVMLHSPTVQHRCMYVLLCILFSTLQESELESIQIQSNIDQLQEEKERLLNSLVESE